MIDHSIGLVGGPHHGKIAGPSKAVLFHNEREPEEMRKHVYLPKFTRNGPVYQYVGLEGVRCKINRLFGLRLSKAQLKKVGVTG